jgi:hypothetical protein
MHDVRAAWELLSEAAVRLPWAVPVLMELARLTLAQQDWEGLADVISRLQQVDDNNLAALAYTGEQLDTDLDTDFSACLPTPSTACNHFSSE